MSIVVVDIDNPQLFVLTRVFCVNCNPDKTVQPSPIQLERVKSEWKIDRSTTD